MMAFMLSAWATVLIALGGAAIGAAAGLAGSLFASRTERSKLIHQDRSDWRKLLIEACQRMSDAWLEFRWLVYVPATQDGKFDDKAEEQLGILGLHCAQTVARVVLVFGGATPAGKAAQEVDDSVDRLKQVVLEVQKETPKNTPWDEEAKEKITKAIKAASGAHEYFLSAANYAIQPGSWSESSGAELEAERTPRWRTRLFGRASLMVTAATSLARTSLK
jgi:gas vesicle protein